MTVKLWNLFFQITSKLTLPLNQYLILMNKPKTSSTKSIPYILKQSPIHGTGVFARRKIQSGERIIEYKGERLYWDEALERSTKENRPLNHTFFFSLADGRVIDGGTKGNEARFINHSCDPNCEAYENDNGRVYIYALKDIKRGEELNFSYPLIYEGRHTAAIKRLFECRCGSTSCAGTMLAPKNKKTASRSK